MTEWRIFHERIRSAADETECEWCGAPIMVGDLLYWVENSGAHACSCVCACNLRCPKRPTMSIQEHCEAMEAAWEQVHPQSLSGRFDL